MKLFNIFPLDIFENPEVNIPAFLSSLLIRSNFSLNVRTKLGWRGLCQSIKSGDGWTCKINDSKGVYGIYFHKTQQTDSGQKGIFKLCYFPHPDEEMVEQFSVEAGIVTQTKEYQSHVREFLCYPEFVSQFNIAEIHLFFYRDRDAILCSLKAPKNSKTISESGICVNDKKKVFIVRPGEKDQDLNAFDLAFPFFEVLCSSLTFNVKEAPVYLLHTHSQNITNTDNLSNELIELQLGYGSIESVENSDFLNLEALSKNSIISSWSSQSKLEKPFNDAAWWSSYKSSGFRSESNNYDLNSERPQFILLSGFLGSGKTSFLKHFIEYHTANNRFVAVIQNEIGESGLDGKLLEDEYAVLEMDEGCVCCSLIGQLQKGIKQILNNHNPDVIILETTGLANPMNMISELDDLNDLIKFDSVTTVVDGINIQKLLKESKIIEEQIKSADILLLNKIDLMKKNQLVQVRKLLQDINPNAIIVDCKNGDINPALLYPINMKEYLQKDNSFNESEGLKQTKHKSHSHKEDGLGSIKIPIPKPLNREKFNDYVRSFPSEIFRSKGIVKFENDLNSYVFQYVNGRHELNQINNQKANDYFIIIIGKLNSLNHINYKFIN